VIVLAMIRSIKADQVSIRHRQSFRDISARTRELAASRAFRLALTVCQPGCKPASSGGQRASGAHQDPETPATGPSGRRSQPR
jgi:hypothetical protein